MRALIVDDNSLIVEELADELKRIRPDAECFCFTDPNEALETAERERLVFDVALLDVEMPLMNGLILTEKLRERQPNVNIIFVTGYSEYSLNAFELYASAFLTKPINPKKLREALENLRHPIIHTQGRSVITSVIGLNINRCREKAGLSIKELAAKMGVAVQTVYRWESGERLPDVITFTRLAQLLGVNVETLMRE